MSYRSEQVFPDSRSRPVSNSISSESGASALVDNRQASPVQRKLLGNKVESNSQPIQKAPNNTGLPDQLKFGMENLSGHSLDHVKVNYNSPKPAEVQAHAYAQGNQIHLASGQEKHLPHELSHVVQQMEGRVKPTTKVNGLAVNDNAGLEKEADVMGAKALNGSSENTSKNKVEVSQFKGGTLIDIYKYSGEKETLQRQEVIQRIIVVADSQLDYNQFVGVYQMLKNGIDHRVTLLSILKNSHIQGEQIGLRGHGYGPSGKYAGMEVGALAMLLKEAGVGKSNAVIDLLSCRSGSGGGASYAEELATAMGHESTVYANKGLGVVMDDGYSYSKRERVGGEKEEYAAIFSDCKQEVAAAEAIAAEGKSKLLKPGITEPEVKAIFMEYGPMVLHVAGTLYARLYQHQRKLLAPHDHPDKGLHISPRR